MHFILFTSNENKIKECKRIFNNVYKYTDFIKPFNVIENGNTFAQNAKIKLLALKNKLNNIANNYILMSEDSGLCVKDLDYKPGIYSSRYSSINDFTSKEEISNSRDCSSDENINKVIKELNKACKKYSKAYFVSCVCIYVNNKIYTAHGFLHGKVIDKKEGTNGFGYDPIFIPNGYKDTLGMLESKIKDKISHRSKALELIKLLLK